VACIQIINYIWSNQVSSWLQCIGRSRDVMLIIFIFRHVTIVHSCMFTFFFYKQCMFTITYYLRVFSSSYESKSFSLLCRKNLNISSIYKILLILSKKKKRPITFKIRSFKRKHTWWTAVAVKILSFHKDLARMRSSFVIRRIGTVRIGHSTSSNPNMEFVGEFFTLEFSFFM
jgi:hypothetical protein